MKHVYLFTGLIVILLLMVGVLSRVVKTLPALLHPEGYGIPAPVTSSQAGVAHAVTAPLPTLAPFTSAQAAPVSAPEKQADLINFVQSLENGKNELVGIYAPSDFALPVVQQPQNRPDFVSTNDNEITEFSLPKKYGSTGLLAHNFLSGQAFYNLTPGQEVILVYGNGKTAIYRVTRIEKYQAISPDSPLSDFIDLADAQQTHLSSSQLFHRIYGKSGQAVFQTCIDAHGDPSWGRMFVIAEPVTAIQPIPQSIQPSLN